MHNGRVNRTTRVLSPALALALVVACSTGPRDAAGAACERDGDCGGLLCAFDEAAEVVDLEPAPLACAAPRQGAAPGAACERGEQCDRGLCLLSGSCARACLEAADCDGQERCQRVFARTGDDALVGLGACVPRVDDSCGSRVEHHPHVASLEPGENTVLLPEAPGSADVDLYYVLEHEEAPALSDCTSADCCRSPLCARRLVARDSEGQSVLFDDALDYAKQPAPVVPIASGELLDPLVIRIDVQVREALAGASLELALRTETAGELRITVVQAPSAGQGGRLELNLFYLGDLQPSASGAAPAVLVSAVDAASAIFEREAGIQMNAARHIAVPGALPREGLAFPGPDDAPGMGFTSLMRRYGVHPELPELFGLSAGAGNCGLNLFVTGGIEPLMSGQFIEALAGNTPGPPGMQGTRASGIVVSASMMAQPAELLGRSIAHEVGHYLGLFHPVEQDGSRLDPLLDTLSCAEPETAAACASENLMHYAVSMGSLLTEEQAAVLARSPMLK